VWEVTNPIAHSRTRMTAIFHSILLPFALDASVYPSMPTHH
jgi:hypothetical protein